ncbi:MAG: amidase [Cytophagales bacterium]|nr:amidase [Cytophagales bacterium]
MQPKLPSAPCDITALSASALSNAIHTKRLSCTEVMQAFLQRIALVNPSYNAIISLRDSNELLAQAKAHDAMLAAGTSKGWLHGIPQAIKDLSPTAGMTTTYGSPLMAANVPQEDSLMVQRMRAAGAIIIGKTNVPEFGLGSHSFNTVFGSTKNAFDVTKTAGGSSGGAAVALAQHLLPVADGSDFMGSLRNPAGWNNIIGLRPSQGRVPMLPAPDVWLAQMGTEGPMGRTLEDVARLMHTQAGFDARSPLSIHAPFDLAHALKPMRDAEIKASKILWLGDIAGYLPMEAGISSICETALQGLSNKGCKIDALGSQAQIGFQPDHVWNAWLVWRQALVGARLAPFVAMQNGRAHIKPEALYEYDASQTLTGQTWMNASVVRTGFYQAMLKHLDTYDAIALPSAQVWPFDVNLRYPQEIKTANGIVVMDTYHRWMESSIYATFAGLPAISVPAGFGKTGLPMGLQLIGKPQGDADLLRLARLSTI